MHDVSNIYLYPVVGCTMFDELYINFFRLSIRDTEEKGKQRKKKRKIGPKRVKTVAQKEADKLGARERRRRHSQDPQWRAEHAARSMVIIFHIQFITN